VLHFLCNSKACGCYFFANLSFVMSNIFKLYHQQTDLIDHSISAFILSFQLFIARKVCKQMKRLSECKCMMFERKLRSCLSRAHSCHCLVDL